MLQKRVSGSQPSWDLVFCSGECKPSANFAILPLLIHCILHFMSAAVVQCWVWVWVEILQPTGCTTRWTLSVYCSKLRVVLQAGGCITHTADALALASLSVSVEIRAENAPYQRRMPLKNRTQLKEAAESESGRRRKGWRLWNEVLVAGHSINWSSGVLPLQWSLFVHNHSLSSALTSSRSVKVRMTKRVLPTDWDKISTPSVFLSAVLAPYQCLKLSVKSDVSFLSLFTKVVC